MSDEQSLNETKDAITPQRYRPRKQVFLEAVQITTGTDWDALAEWCDGEPSFYPIAEKPGWANELDIFNDNGTESARLGDWVVRGATGMFFRMSADEFAATYEPVEVSE